MFIEGIRLEKIWFQNFVKGLHEMSQKNISNFSTKSWELIIQISHTSKYKRFFKSKCYRKDTVYAQSIGEKFPHLSNEFLSESMICGWSWYYRVKVCRIVELGFDKKIRKKSTWRPTKHQEVNIVRIGGQQFEVDDQFVYFKALIRARNACIMKAKYGF